MKAVATALAAVLVALVALTFAGCASQPIPEPARTAATPEVAAPGSSCRQSGRTTMVRGDCSVDWGSETVRVSGACDVTPGTTSAGPEGRSCLRLQFQAGSGGCTVKPWWVLSDCGTFDATLLTNGELHVQRGHVCARAISATGGVADPGEVACR